MYITLIFTTHFQNIIRPMMSDTREEMILALADAFRRKALQTAELKEANAAMLVRIQLQQSLPRCLTCGRRQGIGTEPCNIP